MNQNEFETMLRQQKSRAITEIVGELIDLFDGLHPIDATSYGPKQAKKATCFAVQRKLAKYHLESFIVAVEAMIHDGDASAPGSTVDTMNDAVELLHKKLAEVAQ